jgi:hypothetical protein
MSGNSNSVTLQVDVGPIYYMYGEVFPGELTLNFTGVEGGFMTIPVAEGSEESFNTTYLPDLKTSHSQSTPVIVNAAFVPVPPSKPTAANFSPGQNVRCDALAFGATVGCVNPDFIPTMTSMQSLPSIARNIRAQIEDGKPSTVTRLADTKAQAANRSIVCNSAVVAARPVGTECDEYPFAATYEGGIGAGYGYVPAREQRSQSGLITSFTRAQRLMDGDKYVVKV